MSTKEKDTSVSTKPNKKNLDDLVIREAEIRTGAYEMQHKFIVSIKNQMNSQNISLRELAKRIDKSASHVSQVLTEGQNTTLRTIFEISSAIDLEPCLKFYELESHPIHANNVHSVNWIEASQKTIQPHKSFSNNSNPWDLERTS